MKKGNINIMKISKEKLKTIIKEELDTVISRIFTRRILTESESSQTILVQLSTSWCPPCKEIKKMLTLAGVSAKQWIYVDLDSQSQINQNKKYIKMVEKLQGPVKSIPVLLLLTPENPKGEILDNNIFLNMSGDQEKLKDWMAKNKISTDGSLPDPIQLSDDPANPSDIKK